MVDYPCCVITEDQVKVRFFAGARAAAGCDQIMVGPGTLQDVIAGLQSAFPALTSVTPVCSFLVDGLFKRPHADGPLIAAGSMVDVLPPFAGG
jgi:molybdopterin synthase sulfur carrier subunit